MCASERGLDFEVVLTTCIREAMLTERTVREMAGRSGRGLCDSPAAKLKAHHRLQSALSTAPTLPTPTLADRRLEHIPQPFLWQQRCF